MERIQFHSIQIVKCCKWHKVSHTMLMLWTTYMNNIHSFDNCVLSCHVSAAICLRVKCFIRCLINYHVHGRLISVKALKIDSQYKWNDTNHKQRSQPQQQQRQNAKKYALNCTKHFEAPTAPHLTRFVYPTLLAREQATFSLSLSLYRSISLILSPPCSLYLSLLSLAPPLISRSFLPDPFVRWHFLEFNSRKKPALHKQS